MDRCQVVIMAGGQGERLWPLSTARRPKQFQPLLAGRVSPFQEAFGRALALVGEAASVWTVTREAYVDLIRNEVAGFEPANIIAEPCQRSTAPCIALAAAVISRCRPQADVAVFMPADHQVEREPMVAALKAAVSEARRTQAIVCLGVPPTRPHTGYGYIEVAEAKPGEASMAVRKFTEKPREARAREFIASGRHFWNAGIFVWPLELVAAEFARHAPEIARFMEELRWAQAEKLSEWFAALPNVSVDYAVMERTANIRLVPLRGGWSDLGSFSALAEAQERDAAGNAVFALPEARVVAEKVSDSIVHLGTPRRVVALCGLKGMIVVDTPEGLLVCAGAHEGRIRELGRKAEAEGAPEPLLEHRPWGSWETLASGPGFKVKRIRVRAGHRLSLQAHRHRSEHWVALAGSPEAEVGGRKLRLSAGEHVFVPAGSRHRLANPGPDEATVIEVQLGEVLAEDDIVRFEDDYGRAPEG